MGRLVIRSKRQLQAFKNFFPSDIKLFKKKKKDWFYAFSFLGLVLWNRTYLLFKLCEGMLNDKQQINLNLQPHTQKSLKGRRSFFLFIGQVPLCAAPVVLDFELRTYSWQTYLITLENTFFRPQLQTFAFCLQQPLCPLSLDSILVKTGQAKAALLDRVEAVEGVPSQPILLSLSK